MEASPAESAHREAQVSTRLADFESWLAAFIAEAGGRGVQLSLIPDAARTLNDLYWKIIEAKVRPFLAQDRRPQFGDEEGRHYVDRHKIVSALELVVMCVLPIRHASGKEQLKLNAGLALFIAKTILIKWNTPRLDLTFPVRTTPSFDREHMAWLTTVNPELFPILSNSTTWYVLEELWCERARQIPKLRAAP